MSVVFRRLVPRSFTLPPAEDRFVPIKRCTDQTPPQALSRIECFAFVSRAAWRRLQLYLYVCVERFLAPQARFRVHRRWHGRRLNAPGIRSLREKTMSCAAHPRGSSLRGYCPRGHGLRFTSFAFLMSSLPLLR